MEKKLPQDAKLRIAKKIEMMKREQEGKPQSKRRGDKQLYAVAYQMEKDGKLKS